MRRKYAKDGLVTISVSVDPVTDDDGKVDGAKVKEVLAFLQKEEATFPNLLLNESQEFWERKIHLKEEGVPTVFVFDRQGKWAQFKPGNGTLVKDEGKNPHPTRLGKHYYRYTTVEALVQKLLKEK